MNCINHPDREAVAQCSKCKVLLCDECRILSKDGTIAICRPCLTAMRQAKAQVQPQQTPVVNPYVQTAPIKQEHMKFCKYCGGQIPEDAVICTLCGRQVEQMTQNQAQPSIVINNDNTNMNTNVNQNVVTPVAMGKPKNKWVALLLCLLIGYAGAHKFYEEKFGMGILYLLTCGLFFVGIVVDAIALLGKPTTYYI